MTGEVPQGEPEGTVERSLPDLEPSIEGLHAALDMAAEHVATAARLRVSADAYKQSPDFIVAAQGVRIRKRANEQVQAALAITEVLDTVLPLPDDATWNAEVSARASAIAEQRAAEA